MAGDVSGRGLGRNQLPVQGGLAKLQRHRVHAQAVLAGIADEGLRIDRPGEVDVQIGALGKLLQKSVQRQRPLALVGADRRGRRAASLSETQAGALENMAVAATSKAGERSVQGGA